MASFIVDSVAKRVGSLLVEEGQYLYGVSEKAERLQAELQWVRHFLEDADNREHKDKLVKQWIVEIRDIAYEAEDIIESYVNGLHHHQESGIHSHIQRFVHTICNAWDLHKVCSNIDGLRARITELTERLHTYGVQSVKESEGSTRERELRRTYLCVKDQHVIEMRKEMEEVINALLSKDFPVVGIWGMGGLGKTTLAKKIVKSARVHEHFDVFVWIYVSQNVERRGAFEEILDGLGYKPTGCNQSKIKDLTNQKLLEEICKILQKKRCLVVLDDIWTFSSWRLLEPAFGTTLRSSSSKLLLTTRNEELPRQADPKAYSLNLRLLNKDEAWALLNERLTFLRGHDEDVVVDGEMEKLGRQMVEHCKGLPLAIVALAGILATKKTAREWKDVQDRTSIMNEDVLSVLELSFYELPYYLKPCFMYLGHFPEDHEIPVEKLYSLWDAEGIVAAQNQEASRLEIAERYLNELVQRSMVLVDKYWTNGRIRSCRLHDVMRHICLNKCKEVNFLAALDDTENTRNSFASPSFENKRMRRCAIQFGSGSHASTFLLQHQKDTYCLRSLLVLPLGNSSMFLVSSAQLKKLSKLRVLGLKGLEIDSKAAKVIGELVHLKYLSFEDSSVKELPSCVFHLKFLEALDMRVIRYEPVGLPNKLSKLERLRHLYLPLSFVVIAEGDEKPVIEVSDRQVGQMETLINFHPFQCRMDIHKMVNLRIFSLSHDCPSLISVEDWKCILKSQPIASGSLMNPMTLSIPSGVIDEEPTLLTPSKVQAHISELAIHGLLRVNFNLRGVLPCNLTTLKLLYCGIGNEGLSQLEKFPRLKDLLLAGKWKEKKMSFSDGGFPQLVRLTLSDMYNLEKWKVGEGALPNLRSLLIRNCLDLKMIPQNLPYTVKIQSRSRIKGIQKYSHSFM